MGSGRDKRKKAKGHAPGAGKEKTERKTERNAEKAVRRVEKQAKGEDDIDALLAQFKLQDESSKKAIVEENCLPPSARVYASFVPLNDKEIIMFGGEYYDGDADKMHVYADCYVLNTDKLTWRHVHSPGGPLPRTSHQAVVTRSYMYVFGGEFTSLNQRQFKHYGDLWRLRLDTWEWEQLPSKGGPSARSGHRMALHKGRLILFGGFYDAGKEVRYYNDLWVYDLEELRWESVGKGASAPAPRGGCQLAIHAESATMYVIGGYSVKHDPTPEKGSSKTGKRSKGTAFEDAANDDGKSVVHDDVWALDLATWHWERVKKAGMAPTPRTSFGVAVHKQRAVMFGGVLDMEGAGDRLYSELFNELYQFNMTTRRWYPVAIRWSKAATKASTTADSAGSGANADVASSGVTIGNENGPSKQQERQLSDKHPCNDATSAAASSTAPPAGVSAELHAALSRLAADRDSPLVRAATRIQAAFRGHAVRKAYRAYKLGGTVSELLYSPATYGIDLSSANGPKPRARSAPMVAVLRNTLWLWGGIVEISHNDVVLDDLWALDLNKLDGWRCLKENTAGEDAFKELSDWETDEEHDNDDAI